MKASGKRYVVRTKFFDIDQRNTVYHYLTPVGVWHEDLAQAKRFRTQMDASRARTRHAGEKGGTVIKIVDAVTDDIVSKING